VKNLSPRQLAASHATALPAEVAAAASPAARIGAALGGTRMSSGEWSCPCPTHDDARPSFTVRDRDDGRGVLVHCHAGCTQAELLAELRRIGLWDHGPPRKPKPRDPEEERRKIRWAQKIWKDSGPARQLSPPLYAPSTWKPTDTPVVVYLKGRGIRIPPPESLRFHRGLYHADTKQRWPAMIAVVMDPITQAFRGVHRTYLQRDGRGRLEHDAKKMLGPCSGGVVKLAAPIPGKPLMIGEGIETCLSAMQLFKRPAWAVLAAGFFAHLELPAEIDALEILVDRDDDGVGEEKCREAAARWVSEGRTVELRLPPNGQDFNDYLLQRRRKP